MVNVINLLFMHHSLYNLRTCTFQTLLAKMELVGKVSDQNTVCVSLRVYNTWISRKEMSMLWMTSTLSTLGSSSLLFIRLSCSFSSSPEYCSLHLAKSDLNFSLRCSLDCTTNSFSSCLSLCTRVCWQENASPWRSPKMSEKMREPSCCCWDTF